MMMKKKEGTLRIITGGPFVIDFILSMTISVLHNSYMVC